MDYEEKYKEALKRARELHLNNDVLQYIFTESEENDNPCFHPLSSMTEEEKIELYTKAGFYYHSNFELETDEFRAFSDAISENKLFLPYPIWGDDLAKVYDWLNEHNYDYRGLI
jgi:hypothetical protein